MSKKQKCALCKEKAQKAPYNPFCSAKCKDVDLYNWLAGHYRISTATPAPKSADMDEDNLLH